MLAHFIGQLFLHTFSSMIFIITIIAIIIFLKSILIGFHWMSLSVTGAHVCGLLFLFCLSLR